jgi:NADPH-dependent 2,4-dienoyl-CoA reductase/sulfur reductase-like enzyme/Pyruvate/2-oxoacid:ferredoxin oxidoreductase delta subunit
MKGFEGEMLSSALFANGIQRFSIHTKGGAPQGIFCANGQCSQCTVIVDGLPKKACITPLEAGLDVRTMNGLPRLPEAAAAAPAQKPRVLACDVLVIGGGPSGLGAAVELAKLGFSVVVADDKASLGGKLVLQTHKFFGSERDCYAGTRGIDIAKKLEAEVRSFPNVTVLANSPVVGLFKDSKAGIYADYSSYLLVDFKAVVVAAGARERSVLFPGNDLPGVYGAGAFQTLVNRDLVRAANRVLIVGSGNVGLIGAYHALQAGIEVAGIVELLDKVNGYKVHADKIVRMGVPIHLSTTVVSVEGEGRVERATVAQVGKDFKPLLDTARTYDVDTVLVATGLASCDEFYRQAREFGFDAVKAGDADEIAEASSAMFGGRIAALALAKIMGRKVEIDPSWVAKREVLKSKPGNRITRTPVVAGPSWQPVFFCDEEIPCNPCVTACPSGCIELEPRRGDIMDLPRYVKEACKGCSACVAACPGLAISLLRRIDEAWSEVMLPFEFAADFEPGARKALLDQGGNPVEEAELLGKTFNKKYRTWILRFKVSAANAPKVIGIRVQDPSATASLAAPRFSCAPDDAIVCRCERVSFGELVRFVKENGIRDVNQLKSIRAGMGACGSKTCSALFPSVFRAAGVDFASVEPGSLRPLAVELPMSDILRTPGERPPSPEPGEAVGAVAGATERSRK